MAIKGKVLLYMQTILGRISAPLIVPLYFLIIRLAGYRIRDIGEIRKSCREQLRKHDGPWLICANHLTMIDSLVLTYGMFSLPGHFTLFRKIPWNLPESNNFQKKNIVLAVLCYVAKCIPITRGGDRDQMRSTLEKCGYLLDKGNCLMVFPEGGRSRTGRVDTEGFSYGVGRFVKEHPDCKVMCLYLRGDAQETYSLFPKWGEHFSLMMDILVPERAQFNGVRAQRFYAEQIILKLARMEESYFAVRRERHSQFRRFGSSGKRRQYPFSQPSLHAE